MWNCLWGNALKRSPGIIRKSRVSYPVPGFLSSATWPSLPKKHYNGLNQTISLPRTHSNYRNNQARWRLGNAEMSIVVTSNDGKKNCSRKITSVDFNYKTCLVRVPNASYRCAVWKFSKKAGFAKVCSAETLTGTGYTKHQVYRLNVASNRQRLMLLN